MNVRIFAALLAAGGVAYACVPRAHSIATVPAAPVARNVANTPTHGSEKSGGRRHSSRAVSKQTITSALDVTVERDVNFALHVTNTGDHKLELQFPNGQTHDIVVLDQHGRVVWRWSAGRMFTQALQNRVVDSKDAVTFEERWTPSAMHGTFTAVATLQSANFPVEQRTEFTLP